MLAAQVHRGPDDEGIEVLGSARGTVGLGSRRLAILDLTPAGHQPMRDPETGTTVAYNGEIYNFPELRAELERSGHVFHGRGDTEVLLHAYRRWGIDFLDRLRGMFAFVLWDAARHRTVIARDHLGIKPLYYSFTPDGFVCASEIRVLLASGLIDPTVDRRAVGGYLAYGAVQEPLTILRAVHALESGSWLEVGADGRETGRGRYWDFPTIEPAEGRDLVDEGRALLERSVARHMLSDVPLGVFLSSGIDSTSVAGLAARASDREVHAFTVSIPEDSALDEKPAAARSASRLGLTFHDVPVDSSTALEWAAGGLRAMDQPSMDGLNTYIVSRAVRAAGLTVALSGQGGDEVFGGYRSFTAVPRMVDLARAARILPVPLRRALAGSVARVWGRTGSSKARDLAVTSPELPSIYFSYRRLLSDEELAKLGYRADPLGLATSFLDHSATPNGWLPDDDFVSVSRLETRFYLGNTLLRDGDVFGMANSLEIRVPFLDRDVVDWAFRLPGAAHAPSGSAPKHLLRQMCADILTEDQLEAPKRGFGLPIAAWMKGPLRDVRSEALATLVATGIATKEGVDAIERAYLDDTYRSSWTRVWSLVTLGHWLQEQSTTVRLD
jgi:asparagine synthase (glutamine-hydrolysing)